MRSPLDAGSGEAELPRGRRVEPAPVVPFLVVLVVVGLAETQRDRGRTLFCQPRRVRPKMDAVFAYSVGD